MSIVYELHFKESAEEHVKRAKEFAKAEDYLSAAYEWQEAIKEGYYLGLMQIASYYNCDFFNVEGYPGKEKYELGITLLKRLLDFDIRKFDYDRIMATLGCAYKKLGYIDMALDYFEKAGDEGLYHLYIYHYGRHEYGTANRYYDRYKSISHADPGHIYFDL